MRSGRAASMRSGISLMPQRELSRTDMTDTGHRTSDIGHQQAGPSYSLTHSLTYSLNRRGQSTLEYAVFIAVVAAALLAMQTYVRRSIQGQLKMVERQINAEATP